MPILILAFAVLLGAGCAVVEGYCLLLIWNWFVVPEFDVAPLSLPGAVGVLLVVGFLTYRASDKKYDPSDAVKRAIVNTISKCIAYLAIAGVLKLVF